MSRNRIERNLETFAFWALVILAAPVIAQQPDEAPIPETVASFNAPLDESEQPATNHPLRPALQLAEEAYHSISENIQDYTCTIVRRERIAGKLGSYEFINAKIRHQQTEDDNVVTPFSVYLNFIKPASVEGREALFVDGRNAGKVFVRRGGQRMSYLSSYIKPDSRLALRENRYPITDVGFKRLIERLVKVIHNDMQYDECEVHYFANAKVGERTCTRIEVIHPIEREHFTFNRAMVFVDDQDKLPVGYVSYFWPAEKGGQPRLSEEYIYTDINLNVGLTEKDFDRDNPEYGFARGEEEEGEEE